MVSDGNTASPQVLEGVNRKQEVVSEVRRASLKTAGKKALSLSWWRHGGQLVGKKGNIASVEDVRTEGVDGVCCCLMCLLSSVSKVRLFSHTLNISPRSFLLVALIPIRSPSSTSTHRLSLL